MDLNRAFDDFNSDEQVTRKAVVGAVIASVPLVNIAALGYEVRLARRVAAGLGGPLPAWDDPGALLREGFWLAVARLLYRLPIFLVIAAGLLLALPRLQILASQGGGAAVELSRQDAAWLAALFAAGLVVVLAWSFVLSLFYPAINAQYVRRGSLAACFDLPAMFGFIGRNTGPYLRSWITLWAAGVAAGLAGSLASALLRVLPCLGTVINMAVLGWLSFVVLLLRGHFTGQLLSVDGA